MWNWFKDNTAAIGVLCIILGLFGGLVKFTLVDPMHQRFDAIDQRFDDFDKYISERFNTVDERFNAVDQRFDAVDQRLDSLTSGVSELRRLTARITERISRNEGEIDVIPKKLPPDAPVT